MTKNKRKPMTVKDLKKLKPSQLLRLALTDLMKAERNSKIVIDMYDWYQSHADSSCSVCLAGAVMVGSCQIGLNNPEAACHLADTLVFEAIDYFRKGDLADALVNCLGFALPRYLPEKIDIVPYEENRKLFKREMRELIVELERLKL